MARDSLIYFVNRFDLLYSFFLSTSFVSYEMGFEVKSFGFQPIHPSYESKISDRLLIRVEDSRYLSVNCSEYFFVRELFHLLFYSLVCPKGQSTNYGGEWIETKVQWLNLSTCSTVLNDKHNVHQTIITQSEPLGSCTTMPGTNKYREESNHSGSTQVKAEIGEYCGRR